MRYGLGDIWMRFWCGWSDVDSGVRGEVSGATAEADLKITAAHIFDEVADEVSDEADFDEEAAFNIGEADAIWKLMMTDRNIFDDVSML